MIFNVPEATKPNMLIIIGSIMFVIFTLAVGTSNIVFSQEIVFIGSFAIILTLLFKLSNELDLKAKKMLLGTRNYNFCIQSDARCWPRRKLV